jgi:hypothetical protein
MFLRTILIFLLFIVSPAMAVMSRSEARKELRLKTPKFTEKELKAAYRTRSLETHPDKGGSDEEFVKVAEAYEVLSEGGGEAGGGYTFTGENGEEGRMRQAEDMFFEMFDEYFNGDAADFFIDKIFAKQPQEVWLMKAWKSSMKWVARLVISKIMSLLEDDTVMINVNGQSMSGADFKAWRERSRTKRDDPARRKTQKEDL